MNKNELSESVVVWVRELKHSSSTIQANVRDALEGSETEADCLGNATAGMQMSIAEYPGHLQRLASIRGEVA